MNIGLTVCVNLHLHGISDAAMLQMLDGIRGDQPAAINDDDLAADGFHFGKNVRAENNSVLTGEAQDQVAGFRDLFRVETRGRFIQDKNFRVVNDGLRQPDALTVTFGEFRNELGFYVGHGTALHDLFGAAFYFSAGHVF